MFKIFKKARKDCTKELIEMMKHYMLFIHRQILVLRVQQGEDYEILKNFITEMYLKSSAKFRF